MRFSGLVFFLAVSLFAKAQDPIQNGEQLTLQEVESLAGFALAPTDTSLDQLAALPLNDFKRYHLWKHIKKHGWPVVPQELLYLPGWDSAQITTLWPLLAHTNPTRTYPPSGKVLMRWNWQLEKTAGLDNGTYEGPPWGGWIFVGEKNKATSWHLLAERDAGEVEGLDLLSAHVLRTQGKTTVLLGDYQLRLGQGLTLWTGYGPMDAFEGSRYAPLVTPHQGREEVRFLRGTMVSTQVKRWKAYLLYSNRHTSAAMHPTGWRNLSPGTNFRSSSERARKNNLHHELFGSVMEYKHEKLSWGAFLLHNTYSQQYEPLGRRAFVQLGHFYRLYWKAFLLQGELSWSGGLASSNTLNWVVGDWTFFAQSAWQSTKFSAPLAASWLRSESIRYRLGASGMKGKTLWQAALDLSEGAATTRLSGTSQGRGLASRWSLAIPLHDSTWRGMVGTEWLQGRHSYQLDFAANATQSWMINVRLRWTYGNNHFFLCNQLAFIPTNGQALYGYQDGLPGDFLIQPHHKTGNVSALMWKYLPSQGILAGLRLEREMRFFETHLGTGQDQSEGPMRHTISAFVGVKW